MEHKLRRPVRFADLRFILRGNKKGLATLSALSFVTAISETFLLGAIVQSVSALSNGKTEVSTHLGPTTVHGSIPLLLGLAIVAATVRGVMSGLVALNAPLLAAASRERQRRRIFAAYLQADWAMQSSEKSGRLLQTLIGSVNEVNAVVNLLAQAMPALLTLAVLLTVALILNTVVTLSLLALGAVIALALRPLRQRARKASRADARGRDATASHVAGVLAAASEITVLGAGQGVLDIGFRRIAAAERHFGRAMGLRRLAATISQSVTFLFAAIGLFFISVADFDINFTTVGTITVLLLRGAGLAQQIQTVTSQYGAVAPFAEQVRTVIHDYHQRRRRFGTRAFPERFDIVLEDAEYTYPGTSQVSVRVPEAHFAAGTSTAVVGPSGAGKSTLIQLILRLRQPTRGTILIGGVPAGEISEEAFSAKVAYLPQAPHLIPGTIAENIAFFRPQLGQAEVVRAAKLAHIHDDIERMADGYETMLDSHVDAMSGGQKQRLALARALANRPAILVLDEPTSALDAASEANVIDTLTRLHGETTVIMITHRASTTEFCDSVLRIERGSLHELASAELPEQA